MRPPGARRGSAARSPGAGRGSSRAKRAFDVVVGSALLAGLSPVLAAGTVAQRIEGNPVLWRSPRVGRDGHAFELLMFRTMRDGAELTRVGRAIRNRSLDHLPMLVNVVRGDLALVGPRPTEPERVDRTDPDWQRVLTVRPGLVSYAILCLGRTYNATDPAARLRLEAAYVRRAGLAFDLRLLARAAAATIRSGGNVKARGEPMDEPAG